MKPRSISHPVLARAAHKSSPGDGRNSVNRKGEQNEVANENEYDAIVLR
jgi:hypothetical protein